MRKIFIVVISIHLSVILWMAISPTPKKENKKPLFVKTVMPKQAQIKSPSTSIKTAAIAAKPAPEPIVSITKQEPPKPVAQEKPAKKPTPPPVAKKIEAPSKPKIPTPIKKSPAVPTPKKVVKATPQAPAIPAHLLKELEESIAKIEQKPDKKLSKTQVETSKWQGSLNVDTAEWAISSSSSDSADYEQQLIQSLHETLHLPEYGMVKMKLTLRRDGTVTRCTVVQAESQKNKSYLEKQIRNVKFPHFSGSFFAKQQEYTFILTFCNEI